MSATKRRKLVVPRRLRRVKAAYAALVIIAVTGPAAVSRAQTIDIIFPKGVYGYDQQLGVTVLTRARPLYAPVGIQAGAFLVQPSLDESLFENTNVNATPNSGSWGSRTTAALSAQSEWARNSLSTSISVDHFQFAQLPTESYTDFNFGIGGGYTIGNDQLVAAYSHQSFHQLGTQIGTVRSETPVSDQTDTARLQYTFNLGRIAITPDLSASGYRFGSATGAEGTIDQSFLNNDVVAAGVTVRYALNEDSGVLVALRDLNAFYTSPQAGQPSSNFNSALLLAGLDYQGKSVWRYRLLAGVQVRSFYASSFGTQIAPDIEGSVTWIPTGLTTVVGTLSNSIQSPEIVGTHGYTLTNLRLEVEHELRRNFIIEEHQYVQHAQFFPNGTQTSVGFGAAGTWLLNRNARVSLSYDYSTLSGTGATFVNGISTQTAQFSQNVVAVTLHLAL